MHAILKSLVPALIALAVPLSGAAADNVLLTESPLPFHYPPFDRIHDADFLPALEQGMAADSKEVEAVASNPDAPTFDNTILALERAGATLESVGRIFFSLNGANTNPTLQETQRKMAPLLAAHQDSISLDPRLFARIDALWQRRDKLGLDAESARLLWRYREDFVHAGAQLSEADKAKLRALNEAIATLQTNFSQNVLKERGALAVVFDSKDELAGLTDAEIATAAADATTAGKPGKYVVELQNTTGQPVLTTLASHASREKIMAASLARGSRGGEFDNRAIVAALARKRAERAALLGFPSYAAWDLQEQTVGTVTRLNKLLAQMAAPAVANARKEAADMQALVDADKGGFKLGAADWATYAEKVRVARYAFDEAQLKPYYELDHVLLDGVFYAANQLYGLTFKERHDLPVYEPTVRVFDVFDRDGKPLAIFLADYYARPNKNGGAWMNEYVEQNTLRGQQPVVANHLNIARPPAGEPTLLTQDEVTTAFHEFGHALHGMFSHVTYPRFAGTGVPRDFVEYPSQFNEMWATWPDVLRHFAKHYKTGAPLPQALVDKVLAAQKFNQGYLSTEYLSAAMLDQAWHQLATADVPAADDVLAFEAAALKRDGFDFAPVPPRYRSTYFSHVFSIGYAAGYYSYLWSEVLAADSVAWMKAHGGLKRENGDRYRDLVLSRGGTRDALTMFRDFTGGDPDVGPLLAKRGLDAAP